MKIQFKKKILTARIRSPLKNFEVDEQKIEIREDPLTGEKTRVNVNRTKRFHAATFSLEQFVESSRKECPFCPENLDKSVSKFVSKKERIEANGITVFPNLYPYSSNHAILVMTKEHYLPLNKFTPAILLLSFQAAQEFFKEFNASQYPSINFNYMPPAAASLVHPHMQLLIEDRPLNYLGLLLKKSKQFYSKNRKNYWLELIKEEKKLKERFIGETKHFVFLSKYAPRKNDNIQIIAKGISSLFEAKKEHLKDLSNGLSLIFKGLHEELNVNSLNFSSFSGTKETKSFYRLNFEIVSRARLKEFYTSDIGFMEYMQNEPVAETLPEDTAKALYFGKLKNKV
jgi:galactose-1-phosphate uridylyltransferase